MNSNNPSSHKSYPIPIPDRLPVRIDPCPIVEAIFELRFATREPWRTLPGILASHIREHYSEQKDLPLAKIPEEVRRQDPMLSHLPLMQFLGQDFLVQLGPSVISLATKTNAYPGWSVVENEIGWLMQRIQQGGFISEGERLGVRYIDFFPEDVFRQLALGVHMGAQPLTGVETQLTTVFRREIFTLRLLVTNGAMVEAANGPRRGSVLDIDAWIKPLDFDIFAHATARFSEGHRVVKELFFGLVRPEFLASLNPVYQ